MTWETTKTRLTTDTERVNVKEAADVMKEGADAVLGLC